MGWVDDGENSDHAIGPASVEVLLILGPGQRGATNSSVVFVITAISIEVLSFVGVDELSVWEIVHSDSFLGTNDEPVDLGGKEEDIDWGLSIDFIEMSSLDEVPNVDLTVSSTRGDEHSVLGEIEAVDLGLVSNESVHQAHGLVIPDLDGSIPGSRDDDWLLDVVVESDAGNPVGMWLLVDSELANTVDVPDLDVLVHGSRDDLSVVWGESNGKDILLMTNEGSVSGALLQVPESDGSIPRGGQAESAIGGEIDVRDEVRMTLQDLLWHTPFFIIIGLGGVLLDIPHNEGLISGSGDEEFLVLIWTSLLFTDLHAGNPAVVSLEATSHVEFVLNELLFVVHAQN